MLAEAFAFLFPYTTSNGLWWVSDRNSPHTKISESVSLTTLRQRLFLCLRIPFFRIGSVEARLAYDTTLYIHIFMFCTTNQMILSYSYHYFQFGQIVCPCVLPPKPWSNLRYFNTRWYNFLPNMVYSSNTCDFLRVHYSGRTKFSCFTSGQQVRLVDLSSKHFCCISLTFSCLLFLDCFGRGPLKFPSLCSS